VLELSGTADNGRCRLYIAILGVSEARLNSKQRRNRRRQLKPDEIKKLDAYFKRTFNEKMVVKARPRKDDSAEVYLGEEFLGVVYIDDEDGDRSYNFSMAILDVDL